MAGPPDSSSSPAPRRVADPALVEQVRAEVARLRREGRIPTEVRLSQAQWNALSPEMKVGARAGKHTLLFEGLPCVLSIGLAGFSVRTVGPREDPGRT